MYNLDENKDVHFDFTGRAEKNGDVSYQLHAKNNASESRTMKIRVTTTAKYYTGVPGEEISAKIHDLTLEAGKGTMMTVYWSIYREWPVFDVE